PVVVLTQFGGLGGPERAVAPHHLDRRPVAPGREFVLHPRLLGRGLLEHRAAFGGDPSRVAQVEGPEGSVHRVAGDVAQGTGAVVPPAAPAERGIRRVIGPLGRGSLPQVPVKGGMRVVGIAGTINALGPDRPVAPVVDLANLADRPRLVPLANDSCSLAGVSLISHLRGKTS